MTVERVENIVNIVVFVSVHVFDILLNLMTSGMVFDVIFDDFGVPGTPIWWSGRVLETYLNFNEF